MLIMIIQNRLPMLQISENIWFSSCPTLRPVDLLTPRHVRLLNQRPRYFLVNWLNSWKVHHLTFVQRCTGSLYSCVEFTGYMGPQVLYWYRQFIFALVPATDLKEVVQLIVCCADLWWMYFGSFNMELLSLYMLHSWIIMSDGASM